MRAVELVYALNLISRKRGGPQQELAFCLSVENLGYHKTVEVHWSGEDGAWHTLPATFLAASGSNRELWLARTWCRSSSDALLPGNVRFALHACMDGADFWENGGGRDHRIEADSGVRLGSSQPLAVVNFSPHLQPDQRLVTVTAAVDVHQQPGEVFVEWSNDRWKHTHRTPLFYVRDLWDRDEVSNARNPNQYGVKLYQGRIKIREAYRAEFAVGCATPRGERWDNNRGANYVIRRGDLKVLTLNLHCYQEEQQDAKFSLIARAINELDVDIVCLQEVAEHWNEGSGDWQSNAARIICARLDRPYHLYADWSHRGFDRYREGVAILSKHPFTLQESRYVSSSQDVFDIHARKVVMVQVNAPAIGLVNVFSAHLSWWSHGFREQWDRLAAWAAEKQTRQVAGTLICGDFNIKPGAEGYRYVVDSSEYADQVLRATDRGAFDAAFVQRAPQWPERLAGDHRIDFIWLRRGSRLHATRARPLFTDQEYGRVSDHVGYFAAFELE